MVGRTSECLGVWRRRAGVAIGALGLTLTVAACSTSGPSPQVTAERQAFLAAVHDAVPNVAQYRSNSQLVGLGNAACSDLGSGAGYQGVADQMAQNDGNLPTMLLGTVITAAAQHLCPKYADQVG